MVGMGWVELIAVGLAVGVCEAPPPGVVTASAAPVCRDVPEAPEWRGLEAELTRALAAAHAAEEAGAAVVRQVLTTSLSRDVDGTFEDLRWLSRDATELRGALVRALGTCTDTRGFTWIVEQLADEALRDAALVELARLAPNTPFEERERAAARVREHLVAADPGRRRLARSAATALCDEDAVPVWVAQLDGAEPLERGQIAAALERVTGARPAGGEEPEAWERWLADELEWSATQAAAALKGLESEDPAVVVRSLRVLSERPYQRARWAAAIGAAAQCSRHTSVRHQACLALARLGSRAGETALRALAEGDTDEGVRTAARDGLGALR